MQTPNFRRVLAGSRARFVAGCLLAFRRQPLRNPEGCAAGPGAAAHRDAGDRRCGVRTRTARRRASRTSRSPLTIRRRTVSRPSLWSVPEPVVARIAHFKAPASRRADVRVLVMALAAKGRSADAASRTRRSSRTCWAATCPRWPRASRPRTGVRVQVWTYLIPSVLDANKRLRANDIPVVFDPVAHHHGLPRRSQDHGHPRAGRHAHRAGGDGGAVAAARVSLTAAGPCPGS